MDPTTGQPYSQQMIQALMGASSMPNTMTTGQNPTSSYGQGFLTGNMMMPAGGLGSNMAAMGGSGGQAGQQPGMNSSSSLMNGPSTMLSQPTSTMSM